ncbi:SNF2 domain-containing protein / helicase domain-containing protein / zinc finger protein-related [Striga hermonthica]|uniref:SNF2 domain-containing protein / helicase domain-containing protein / zinc finger protein-related n=1 Tax=Striga hermonthica TaxID=68872 RepID=A0A9N7NIM6_STRHE|nr:SNF2 domain-containing protein / helicase domain-containing protein / zinc finger protein-related [Striga hermonthica]
MASLDPIDISSSDSDSDLREIDNYRDESPIRDTSSSVPPRILPAWMSQNNSNLAVRQDPSSSSSSKRQNFAHNNNLSRPRKHLHITESYGPSSLMIDGNNHQKNSSNSSGRLVTSPNIHISHQPLKRSLPASLHASTSNVRSSSPVENVVASELRGMYANSSNGNNLIKENSIWGSGSSSSLYEKKGNRLLPPSLVPGKHTSPSTFVSSNDPFHHTGIVEEGPAGADESLVFRAAVQDLRQPTLEANLPEGLLSVPLLRHQKIALAWMLSKESSGLCLGGILADDQGLGKTVSTIALIQMQRHLEKKAKNKVSCNSRTEALNLDDDGGISGLIALDDANQIKESDDFAILPRESKGFRSRRPTAGTLIVCPASVLRQWARELDEKVTSEAKLSVLVYHGGQRTKDPAALAKYDAVLTTYAIVTNEVPKQPLVEEDDDEQKDGELYGLSSAFSMEKKRKKPSANKKSKKGKKDNDVSAFDSNSGTLDRVKWSRVVLDESQTIKNHRTQVARACCSLRAKRRWCLSGTPIQNSVDELYSYFRFLRYDPYDKFKKFSSSIKSFILRDSVKGYKKLQVVLMNIMLRRTKGTLIDGQPIITLPPKKVHLMRVDFSIEERTFYDRLESDSRRQFKAYAAAGTVSQNYANILLMLLRLRQACDHPLLVKGVSSDPVGKVSSQMAQMLPKDLLVNLLKQLETSQAICLVCKDPPENAVVTMCGHVFCYQCVSDYLTGEDNTCPASACKEQLGADVVFSKSTLTKCIYDGVDGDNPASKEHGENSVVVQSNYVSSKIKSALEILKSHCVSKRRQSSELYHLASTSSSSADCSESIEREKAIVFSQWTSMLDLVEMSLKNSCISYRRLDGTMSIPARDKAVKDFNTDPEVDVMLMSLKAGNLGLNMVAACRVILLDLWWNPTTEDQAIDRAHRIGQTRPVTVSRLTIKDTVEDRILALQEDKRKMVASAFGEDQSGGQRSRLTVEDLRFLFEGR